jgi:hypothetical protein
MPDVITRAIARDPGLPLPASATVPDIASGAVGEAPAVDAPSTGAAPDDRTRYAERAIEDRLRRSIAARSASAPAPTPPAEAAAAARAQDDARERDEIDSVLREWVDLAKATPYSESPSRLLRAVADHDKRPIPLEFELQLDPSLLEDERILDTAAVLYHRLRDATPSTSTLDGGAPPVPLSKLRSDFVAALREDYAKRHALAALLSPSGQPGQKTPFFDGFAIRNAQHKTIDELVSLPEVSADPAFAALTAGEKRHLLARKFEQMGESTSYAIGTPEHSLATALLRIQSYRGLPITTQFDGPASLLAAFQAIEKDWSANPSYPCHPRLLFAAHLARTDGVELMSPEDLLLVYENGVSDRALEELQKGNDVPFKWIALHLSQYEVGGLSWKEQGELARTQIITSLFAALRTAADGNEPIAGFARELHARGALPEKTLIRGDRTARLDALIDYANERLLATFGAPPRFDRGEAATAILRSHGLSEAHIAESRAYVISGDNLNVSKDAYGDLVDEFLDRADWSGLVGSKMTLGSGLQITPRYALQEAEERFNRGLRSNPWVVAKAQENLRTKNVSLTAESAIEEIGRIAANLQTETENHRAWVRGAETWIGMVPVAGPLYNIEEGVRHHDAARAAFSLLFLGADLFDLTTGAGGHGAASRRVHPVTVKMRHAAARLDPSVVDIATHSAMAEAAADPVDIAVLDGDIPLVHRGLAARVRNGEQHIRWRDYDVVHLEDEKRIVPVQHLDGVHYEVDWRSGRRVRSRLPLERDPVSGKLRPRYKPVEAPDARAETIRGSEVETRFTVDAVQRLLKQAGHAELREFDRIFDGHFEYKSTGLDTSTFDAKGFFGRLYERSRTFRRLANRFEDVDGRARNGTRDPSRKWEMLVGETGPLGSPTKAYTDFEYRRIYMPKDATLEAMEYMTASGLQSFTREQVYLHEMIHALTGALDPVRTVDMLNRGPVVYLTDKILNEGGYALAEQVMYRRENSLPNMPRHETIEYHRDAATQAAHAENRYLDPIVDGKRSQVPDDALIEGVRVESRVTVRDVREIVREVAMGEDDVFLSMDVFETKFGKNFGFFASESTPSEVAASDAKVLANFYRRLYRKSETFRHLFDTMPTVDTSVDPAATWRFMLDKSAPVGSLAQGASLQPAMRGSKEIYLLDDGLQYLSANGLRDVEAERKLTYDMVCAIGGFDRLAPGETYRNRGPAVYLTDSILTEAGFHYPKQLVAALASDADAVAQNRLLAYQTSAQRAAATEDRYLSRV